MVKTLIQKKGGMGSMQPSLVCSNHQVQLSRIAETSSPGSRVCCLVHCQVLWVFYLITPLLCSPWFPFSRSKVASGAPALTPMYQSVGWYKEGRDAIGHKGPLWLWLFLPCLSSSMAASLWALEGLLLGASLSSVCFCWCRLGVHSVLWSGLN